MREFCLFLILLCTQADPIIRFEQYTTLPDNFCTPTETINSHAYNYIDNFNPINSFDSNGWTSLASERCNPSINPQQCSTYNLESVRKFPSPYPPCTYCPYHLDPVWKLVINPLVDTSNENNPTTPMFGPCLSNSKSLKMPCLQHYALYPQEFFGKYFYKSQSPFDDSIWQEWFEDSRSFNLPMHQFMHDGSSSSIFNILENGGSIQKNPTNYSLGKGAVEYHLNGIKFLFIANKSVNELLTAEFRKPYTKVNDVEQWMKWAQYFCFPGCHKDASFSLFRIRNKDISGNPRLSYLSLFINDTYPQPITACRPCPNYTASYNWMIDSPAHPKTNILADQCYPWFGAIPTMILGGDRYSMNTTYHKWDPDVDKVQSPSYDSIVDMLICPINTYNRVCAHTKESIYNTAYDTNPPSSDKLKQYACTPCPEGGYHTAGKTGQWYCNPPLGKLFDERELLQKSGNVWGDRVLMGFFPELECGPKVEHCRQCANYNLISTTPQNFNELMIFSKLLAESWCPESYYCPDPFTQTACPLERPWSPIGSWHPSNCSCAMGSYLSNLTTCIPCTSTCTTFGHYLPRSQCLDKNGARKDAPCTLCDNIPTERAIADGVGVELRPGYGSCPFHCLLGSELSTVNTTLLVSSCEKIYSCLPPRARVNKDGKFVYNVNLKYDKLSIGWPSTNTFSCVKTNLFTQQLSQIDTEWQIQPLSCIGICNSSRVCYAQNQISGMIDSSMPWYSLTSQLSCNECPNLLDLPPLSNIVPRITLDLAMGIQYCQNPNIICSDLGEDSYYFNKSAWQCQSCSDREKLVCQPPTTRLRGGGCLRVSTPFNLSVPSADCFSCPIQVPDFNTTRGIRYLNYMNSSASGGCSIDSCPSISQQFYWKQPCGADSSGIQAPCTIDCQPYQFRKTECSANGDLICQNCTINNPGFQKVSNCSLTENSLWKPCDAGYFCDFSGRITACPVNRTSVVGADDISDCFCKVGMQEDAKTLSCIPMQCNDNVFMTNFPGKSLNSTHYMTLDTSTMSSTKCMPCNTYNQKPMAYTRGDGLEITSCVCPRGFYGLYPSSTNMTSIQCIQCPSSPSCTNGKLPASCANGDVKLSSAQQFPCLCASPPFSSSTTNCLATCLPGFTTTSNPRTISSGTNPQLSGSSLYSIKKEANGILNPSAWNRFLISSGYTNYNNSVRSLTVTGCMDDSILGNEDGAMLQAYHYEYVFWILADAGLPMVFSALLQESTVDMSPTNLFTLPQWQVFTMDNFHSTDILVGTAASKWNTRGEQYYTATNGVRDPWIYVAVLVRSADDGHGLFYMKVSIFNTTNNKNTGYWENTVYNISLFPSSVVNINAVPVSITHGTKKLGEAVLGGEGGYFYTAYNTWFGDSNIRCGGLIMTSPLSTTTFINSFCKPTESITSMAITLNQDSSMAMALVSLSSGNIVKIESATQTNPRTIFQPISTSMNLIVLFSSDSPVYISGIQSDTLCSSSIYDGSYCLKVADSMQLTWVDIQGLPSGTAPTIQPMSLAASVLSRGKALLVVSKGSSLFTLSLYRCPSPTQYWDGVACIEQTCLKQVTCTFPMISISNGGGCSCAPGYYQNAQSSSQSLACISCSLPKYCDGVVALTCPFSTGTTISIATSINDCICPTQGTYFNALLTPPKCVECRSSELWCPNKWQSFTCPGVFTTSSQLSTTLITYPTKCTCAPGYTGANCEICPLGFYCPSSPTTTALNTAALYTFNQPPLSNVVVGYINSFFLSYFTLVGTKLPNFATQEDLNKILYTQIVPATNRTLYGIMVMVQIDIASSSSSYDNFKGWHKSLLDYLKATSSTSTISVTPGSNSPVNFDVVQVNRPVQCLTSKVPASPPSTCICAQGYETNKEQCSACSANTFKAFSGAGTCSPCAIGNIAPIKASACIPDPDLLNPTQSSASGPDLVLLLGGVGGGIVGLIILLFVVQTVIKRNHNE
jgi:hypothetical protein